MLPPGKTFCVRLATATVLVPAVLLLTWWPRLEPGFALFIGLLAMIGLYEYYAIVRARHISPETIGGIVSGTLVVISGYFGRPEITAFTLYMGCLMTCTLHIVRGQRSVAGLASSAFGVFYIGWLAAHITLLHSIPGLGAGLITMLIAAVAITDSAAYVVGSAFGKHKLAPHVSPAKSWEGAIAGVMAAVAAMGGLWAFHEAYPRVLGLPDWSLWHYLGVGALLSVAGQIGDLTESCLKRDAGVKDSGLVFPGHGGVLDRCDGFLFAAPVLYYMVLSLDGIPALN